MNNGSIALITVARISESLYMSKSFIIYKILETIGSPRQSSNNLSVPYTSHANLLPDFSP
ncbi:hypothetical protein [Brachyspira innocens]|uniref:hypothetical protein n=1 Tax=Brachyspira innocens TaxID=13264 RepID=UPI0026F2E258|nr:hypothetical protein [Brachyspira innocens]